MVVRYHCAVRRIHHIVSFLYDVKVQRSSNISKKILKFLVFFSLVAIRVYSFNIECQFTPAKVIKFGSLPYDFRTPTALCHLLVINYKATAFPIQQLDPVTGAIVDNVGGIVRRVETITAYLLGQAKNALIHIYRSGTNLKNICFIEYRHKFFGQR